MKFLKFALASLCLLPLAGCYYYPPAPYGCPQPVAYHGAVSPMPARIDDGSNYYQMPDRPTANDYHP